ncbi:MAG TPA: agmatine deiminase [Rheinheimera sp.]|jgi:agmatine deiminase|uniref:agmatine deiminase n=1 Tax=Rheinheimera sp. TaxID=1869214 RepID=UPI002B47B78F|nr:agmatine deiminase [Rheinheimera sp.]HJS16575.1 agmatine deiminase [Rheinheimera sp.]
MAVTLNSTPRADGFFMPAEWAEHKQTWMVWPERTDNWRLGAKPAQQAFCAVIRAIARFEPVTVLASAAQFANAQAQLSLEPTTHPIRVVETSTDDAWCRDTGPTFVTNGKEVRAVDWTFNAWGGLNGGLYFPWHRDDQVAQKIANIESTPRYRTEGFVLEGGAIHVDGEGTLLTTEECLLNKNRNPDLSREQIEQMLSDYLSIDKVIWLKEGIFNDETDGHVDNMCCFVGPAEVLLAWTDDKNDPQYERSRAALEVLENSTDAKGRTFTVHKLPVPAPMLAKADEYATVDLTGAAVPRESEARLAGSYINFYLCNGGLVVPVFDDANDKVAVEILSKLFPQHQVVTVPGREILLGGGNVHCITQQQPA